MWTHRVGIASRATPIWESDVKASLFSQSLFALSLERAIAVTSELGFAAIELACWGPHLDLSTPHHELETVALRVKRAGLEVSALSGLNNFTDPSRLEEQLDTAETLIRLASVFGTKTVKLTPGPPGSAEATELHWECFRTATAKLAELADEAGVRLAFETHMGHLTDTLSSSMRVLQMTPARIIGLTVDFSNMAFVGEDMREVISCLGNRTYNTHVKNGYIDSDGRYHFLPLDEGLTDYPLVLSMLRDVGYDGYLSLECLGPDAQENPKQTARRDLEILRRYLKQLGINPAGRSDR